MSVFYYVLIDTQGVSDATIGTQSCEAATSSGDVFFPVGPGKEEQLCHGKLKKKLSTAIVEDSSCRLYTTDPASFLKERTQRRSAEEDQCETTRSDKSSSGVLFISATVQCFLFLDL